MLWFYATAFSAVVWGVLSAIAKKLMDQDSSLTYTALYSLLALVFYTPVFLYFLYTAGINWTYAAAAVLLGSVISNIAAFLAYNGAIKKGDISKVIPFTRLTPIFTAFFAYFLLNEVITYRLGLGIVLATAGSIVVMKEREMNYLASIEDGIASKAIRFAVASSVFYGLASVADRYATQVIQPEIYTFFIYLGMSLGLLTYFRTREEASVKHLKRSFNASRTLYIITGLLAAAATYAIYVAFSLAPASRVTPVLHLQVLVSVFAGVIFFQEKDLLRKLSGSFILITGVTLVAL